MKISEMQPNENLIFRTLRIMTGATVEIESTEDLEAVLKEAKNNATENYRKTITDVDDLLKITDQLQRGGFRR